MRVGFEVWRGRMLWDSMADVECREGKADLGYIRVCLCEVERNGVK